MEEPDFSKRLISRQPGFTRGPLQARPALEFLYQPPHPRHTTPPPTPNPRSPGVHERFLASTKATGTENFVSMYSVCSHLWAQRPKFLPKGPSSRTVQRVVGEPPTLVGCFFFPRSLPPSFARPLPPLGEAGAAGAGSPLPGAESISRPRWPAGWRRFIGCR